MKTDDTLNILLLGFLAFILASMFSAILNNNFNILPYLILVFILHFFINMNSQKKVIKKVIKNEEKCSLQEIVDNINNNSNNNVVPKFSNLNMVADDLSTDLSNKNNILSNNIGFEGDNIGFEGDNLLMGRMKHMGTQSQLSKNIRSSFNKYSLLPFLEEELREHSNREWWDSDHLNDEF